MWDSVVFSMSPGEIVLVVFACCIGAMLIGAVGIGGVIILPALTVAGVEPATGIVTIFTGFVPVGIVRLIMMARIKGLVPWRAALSAGAAAGIGAAIGGVLVDQAPGRALSFFIGGVALLAGIADLVGLGLHYRRKRRAQCEQARASGQGISAGSSEQSAAPGHTGGDADSEHRTVEPDSSPDAAGPVSEAMLEEEVEIEVEERNQDSRASSEGRKNPVAAAPDGAEVKPGQPADRPQLFRFLSVQTKDTLPGMQSTKALNLEVEGWVATCFEMCVMSVLGLLTGVISVLTGTGGPLIMIPMLLVWKGNKLDRKVIVASLAVLSATLSIVATISLVVDGLRPDALLAIIIGSCALVGMLVGVKILTIASREVLQGGMALLLLAIAALTITQAIKG